MKAPIFPPPPATLNRTVKPYREAASQTIYLSSSSLNHSIEPQNYGIKTGNWLGGKKFQYTFSDS